MIEQTIREQCVYEAIREQSKSHWFYYINTVMRWCSIDPDNPSSTILISQECHDDAITDLAANDTDGIDIDLSKYKSCVLRQDILLIQNQNKLIGETAGSFLDRDYKLSKSSSSVFHPSISINNQSFRGDYKDPNNLFKAICSVLAHRPPQCTQLSLIQSVLVTNTLQQDLLLQEFQSLSSNTTFKEEMLN